MATIYGGTNREVKMLSMAKDVSCSLQYAVRVRLLPVNPEPVTQLRKHRPCLHMNLTYQN